MVQPQPHVDTRSAASRRCVLVVVVDGLIFMVPANGAKGLVGIVPVVIKPHDGGGHFVVSGVGGNKVVRGIAGRVARRIGQRDESQYLPGDGADQSVRNLVVCKWRSPSSG